MNFNKNQILKTVLTGVMAALLAVLSQVAIPLPSGVPVTLQTFAVALAGCVLGPVLGVLSVGVYLSLAAVGVPVLAGFSGGVGAFAGMTGGFLWGFLPMGFLCGLGVRTEKKPLAILLGLAGLIVCHLCGALQFAVVADVSFVQAFLVACAPYLVKDAISVVLAYFAALAVTASLKKAGMGGWA